MAFPSIIDQSVIGLRHRYPAEKELLPHARTGMRTHPVHLLPAKMECILLHDKDRTVAVDSVTFTWGENHLASKSDVTASSEGFLVDLDLSISDFRYSGSFDSMPNIFPMTGILRVPSRPISAEPAGCQPAIIGTANSSLP